MAPFGALFLGEYYVNRLDWCKEYYDTVAGEKSLDLYKTEEMAQEDKRTNG